MEGISLIRNSRSCLLWFITTIFLAPCIAFRTYCIIKKTHFQSKEILKYHDSKHSLKKARLGFQLFEGTNGNPPNFGNPGDGLGNKEEWGLRQEWLLEDAVKANSIALSGGQVFVSWELVQDSSEVLKNWTPTQLQMKWMEIAEIKGLPKPVLLPVLEEWGQLENGAWSGLVYSRVCGGMGPSIATIPQIDRVVSTPDGKVQVIELPSGQAYELGVAKQKDALDLLQQGSALPTAEEPRGSRWQDLVSKAALAVVAVAVVRALGSLLFGDANGTGTTYYFESSSYSYTQIRQDDGSVKRTGKSSSEVRTNIKGIENVMIPKKQSIFEYDE